MTTATVTGEKRRLRTVFLGNETPLTRALCRWLANRTDLKLIVWTDLISWPHRPSIAARIGRRLLARVRRKGVLRVVNEAAYYVIYALILRPGEENRIRQLTEQFASEIRGDLGDVHQIRPVALRDTRLLERVRSLDLDAGFATCTHAYFPKELIRAPRHGVFLWHEGITPEYRGVYPAFWALYRDDLASIGYSLLRMTDRLDAGPVFAQGPVSGADFERDWYCYLSAKSVVDSLPEVGRFLSDLESGSPMPIDRAGAVNGWYSYPTATALISIVIRRTRRAWHRERDRRRRKRTHRTNEFIAKEVRPAADESRLGPAAPHAMAEERPAAPQQSNRRTNTFN